MFYLKHSTTTKAPLRYFCILHCMNNAQNMKAAWRIAEVDVVDGMLGETRDDLFDQQALAVGRWSPQYITFQYHCRKLCKYTPKKPQYIQYSGYDHFKTVLRRERNASS